MNDKSLPKILVTDDDEQIVKQLQWALSDEYTVFPAADRCAALQIIEREQVPVALLDLGLPPHPREAVEGLRTLEELIAKNPLVKVIVVSGNSDRQNALCALEMGAHDILAKPVNLEELKVVLHRVYSRIEIEKKGIEERRLAESLPVESMIGSSAVMKAVFSMIGKVAATDVPVLILGEGGTERELVAGAIHRLGARKNKPFSAINCAATTENLLEIELFGNEKDGSVGSGRPEYAAGGTLFLDQVGSLARELQVKILHFLQGNSIGRAGGRAASGADCRVIAGAYRDLDNAVRDNLFHEDLYFRLAVVKIALPPLRDRGNDILELAGHLVDSFSRELKRAPKKFSRTALQAMRHYSWPGNVRELQNKIKCALVLAEGPFIEPADLEIEGISASATPAGATLREARQELERDIVSKKLEETNWNISRAARALGISRPTLYELVARYGLSDDNAS